MYAPEMPHSREGKNGRGEFAPGQWSKKVRLTPEKPPATALLLEP